MLRALAGCKNDQRRIRAARPCPIVASIEPVSMDRNKPRPRIKMTATKLGDASSLT